MKVFFDDIIFSLQHAGGISVVWQQLLRRAAEDTSYNKAYLEYDSDNISRQELALPDEDEYHLPMRHLERYRVPACRPTEKCIFHSSYFRVLPRKGVKNVTTIHDLTYHFYRSGLAKWIHIFQEWYCLHRSDRIVCISENTKRDLLHFYPHLSQDKIVIVPNAASEEFCRLEHPHNATPFANGEFLLYVGDRVAKYKNYALAVRVAAAAGVPLVIVGAELSRSEKSELDEMLPNRYLLVKNASVTELNHLYNLALAFIYPSDYEGFGIPPLEAQQAGCPVLCQRRSSLPEVLGDSGLMIEHADEEKMVAAYVDILKRLQNGQIDRQAVIEKGYKNAARFSWNESYRKLLTIYRELC